MRPFSRLHRLSTALAQGLVDPGLAGRRSARLARLVSVLLVLACAEVGTHWVLRLQQSSRPLPAGAQQSGGDVVDALAARGGSLFGAAPGPAPKAPSHWRLYGVIGGGAHAGAALIGVDGQPARVYPVGAWVAPGVRLVSTGFGRVELERGGQRSVLTTEPGARREPAMPMAAPDVPGTAPVDQRVSELERAQARASAPARRQP